MVEFKEVDINFPFEVGVLPDQAQALKFVDFLSSLGIKATVKMTFGGNYTIFVAEERDVSQAKLELLRFGNNPFAKAYNQASWQRGKSYRKERSFNSTFIGFSLGSYRWSLFSLTSIVEIICLVVYILTLVPSLEPSVMRALSWTYLEQVTALFELHRVITPVFLHFGILHIAFNLVMFEALARPIERYLGLAKLAYILFSLTIFSNAVELLISKPNTIFGGISGVVYGVIGYMGVLSRRTDLPASFKLPNGLLLVSVIFIGIGFLFDGIANMSHLSGLVLGLVLGFVDLSRSTLNYKARY